MRNNPRRAFMRGLALVPFIGGNVAATDPVFTPIAAVRAFRVRMDAERDDDVFDRMASAECRALESLAELRPTTVRGAAEYLQAFAEYDGEFLSSPWGDAIPNVIAALRGLS